MSDSEMESDDAVAAATPHNRPQGIATSCGVSQARDQRAQAKA